MISTTISIWLLEIRFRFVRGRRAIKMRRRAALSFGRERGRIEEERRRQELILWPQRLLMFFKLLLHLVVFELFVLLIDFLFDYFLLLNESLVLVELIVLNDCVRFGFGSRFSRQTVRALGIKRRTRFWFAN